MGRDKCKKVDSYFAKFSLVNGSSMNDLTAFFGFLFSNLARLSLPSSVALSKERRQKVRRDGVKQMQESLVSSYFVQFSHVTTLSAALRFKESVDSCSCVILSREENKHQFGDKKFCVLEQLGWSKDFTIGTYFGLEAALALESLAIFLCRLCLNGQ